MVFFVWYFIKMKYDISIIIMLVNIMIVCHPDCHSIYMDEGPRADQKLLSQGSYFLLNIYDSCNYSPIPSK